MFINPMWQDEVQRIGKQRCTPMGFRLHLLSDLIGFLALILLLAVPCYFTYTAFCGMFRVVTLWMLLLPFVVAIAGNVLHSYSWQLADARQFKYDYEKRVASWHTVSGTIETFDYRERQEKYAEKSCEDCS